jgi:hypothetical protein
MASSRAYAPRATMATRAATTSTSATAPTAAGGAQPVAVDQFPAASGCPSRRAFAMGGRSGRDRCSGHGACADSGNDRCAPRRGPGGKSSGVGGKSDLTWRCNSMWRISTPT